MREEGGYEEKGEREGGHLREEGGKGERTRGEGENWSYERGREEDDIYCTLSPGLHLFGEGLSDFRDALIQCNETDIIKILVKFIEDLVSCTEGMLGIWTPH